MLHVIERLKIIFPDLNRREFTEDDCWKFVRKNKVIVRLAPLLVQGYYGKTVIRKRKRSYIFLDEKMKGMLMLKTFLHEIGHVCLHEPRGKIEVLYSRRESDCETRQDKEADIFMLLAMVPKQKLIELQQTPFEEIHPFMTNILLQRQTLWEKTGE